MSNSLAVMLRILGDLKGTMDPNSTILDFGCGAGGVVSDLRNRGYESFGCDIQFKDEESQLTRELKRDGLIRLIDLEPYALPFEDETFDFVVSDQVFEHVQSYEEANREIARVLKRTGYCLHIFPSRYKPIESHVFVPFASIWQSRTWLRIWATLGVRNEFQGGNTAAETVERNQKYLRESTNYLRWNEIEQEFRKFFGSVRGCEELFLKNSRRGRYIYQLSRVLPFLPALYSTFRSRVVVAWDPHHEGDG